MSDIWVVNGKTWYSKAVIEKIKLWCKNYEENCKEICKDDRCCSSCFLGGARELADEIMDVIKEVESESN